MSGDIPAISLIDLRGEAAGTAVDPDAIAFVLPRAGLDVEHALEAVRPIVDDVRARGAEAALDWSERLDGVRPPSLRVPRAAIDEAVLALDPLVRAALEESIARARRVHDDQRHTCDDR